MRMHLRLHGITSAGKKCTMEGIIYVGAKAHMEPEVTKMAATGPWFEAETVEAISDGETITIERVENVELERESGPK